MVQIFYMFCKLFFCLLQPCMQSCILQLSSSSSSSSSSSPPPPPCVCVFTRVFSLMMKHFPFLSLLLWTLLLFLCPLVCISFLVCFSIFYLVSPLPVKHVHFWHSQVRILLWYMSNIPFCYIHSFISFSWSVSTFRYCVMAYFQILSFVFIS